MAPDPYDMEFHWNDKDCSTFGKLGSTLCSIKTQEEAQDFWEAYCTYLSRPEAELSGKSVAEVASSNIGYLMGYYGQEERERVYKLFPTATHPIFGHSFGRGYEPTFDEAFKAGEELGRSI